MSNDLPALLFALATENDELRQQLATAQDLLLETAIDAGQLHARIEAIPDERDAWKQGGGAADRVTRSLRLNTHERRVVSGTTVGTRQAAPAHGPT